VSSCIARRMAEWRPCISFPRSRSYRRHETSATIWPIFPSLFNGNLYLARVVACWSPRRFVTVGLKKPTAATSPTVHSTTASCRRDPALSSRPAKVRRAGRAGERIYPCQRVFGHERFVGVAVRGALRMGHDDPSNIPALPNASLAKCVQNRVGRRVDPGGALELLARRGKLLRVAPGKTWTSTVVSSCYRRRIRRAGKVAVRR
jgi:hypothetical protein